MNPSDLNNKKILIIGLQFPEPKSTAAGSRMMQMIHLLQSYSFQIHFATVSPKNTYSVNLKELNIQQHQLKLNDSETKAIFKTINPALVLFDRFITEEQFGWQIDECCPEALKLLDTEDLHFLREARQKSLKETSKITKLIKLSDKAKRELAAIYRCDLTLMISKVEIELLTKEFNIPERLLYYLPFVYDTSSFLKNNSTGFEDRQHFMSIGNFKHNPNLDMVLELYKSIWPKIRKTLKDAEWHIYGAYLPKQIEQLHQPQHGVIVKGRAEDVLETLAFYRVMLAPLRFGAGLKGKCLDSMRCGTPSVTSSIGAEGIAAGDNWPGFIEDNPQLFAENAIALYKGQDIWISKQQRGFEVLHNSFDVELYTKDFQLELSKGLEQLKTIRQQNVVGELLKHHHQRSTKFMSLWIEEKNR